VQRPPLLAQLVERLVLTVPFAKALGKPIKIVLDDSRQNPHHRSLDNFVLAAGFAYRPLLPICLLEPYPLDWRRHLPIGAQPLVQVPQVLVQVGGILRGRYLVPPRRTALTGLTLGFPQALTVAQVTHGVQHHRRIAFGLFGNVLEFHGYGW
jgi:hypothetical protein